MKPKYLISSVLGISFFVSLLAMLVVKHTDPTNENTMHSTIIGVYYVLLGVYITLPVLATFCGKPIR